MNRFTSRKFIVAAVGSVVMIIGAFFEMTPEQVDLLNNAFLLLLAYLGVEGAADFVERNRKPASK